VKHNRGSAAHQKDTASSLTSPGQRELGLATAAVHVVLHRRDAHRVGGEHERHEPEAARLARVPVLHDHRLLHGPELREVALRRTGRQGVTAGSWVANRSQRWARSTGSSADYPMLRSDTVGATSRRAKNLADL